MADPDAAVICATEWQAAIDCVLSDAGGCGGGGCIDTANFQDRFEPDLANVFRTQIAAAPPSVKDEGFCELADEKLCTYHAEKLVRTILQDRNGDACYDNLSLSFFLSQLSNKKKNRAVVVKKRHWHS